MTGLGEQPPLSSPVPFGDLDLVGGDNEHCWKVEHVLGSFFPKFGP